MTPVLVIMGVSGTGKSTVAALLAARLSWDLEEGDNLHSAANVAKMASGHPLTDEDRRPWLDRVAGWIQHQLAIGRPGIITCSALKRSYRDRLRAPGVTFVYLHGTADVLTRRLAERRGHYMQASLLDSQLADLEPPGDDEAAVWIDVGAPAAQEADQIIEALHLA
jgi:carbohydrate kinase (thermoresistant glucokinase family)